jgi:Zn-dependent protease
VTPEQIYHFVVQLAVLLFAVSFHESAHGWVALRFGDTTAHDQGRITMNPAKHLDPIGSLFVPLMLALSGARSSAGQSPSR